VVQWSAIGRIISVVLFLLRFATFGFGWLLHALLQRASEVIVRGLPVMFHRNRRAVPEPVCGDMAGV
jgi:hypothetical protein